MTELCLGALRVPRRSLSFDIIQDCRVVNSMMLIVLLYTCVLFVANTSPGSAQDIRLVGGSANNEGRIEVFRSRQWQTLCDDGWDMNDADIACRQLGYGYAIRVVTDAKFGEGTGGQWNAHFSCTGSESTLEHCITSSRSCTHSEDVGVICSNSSLQQGSLRLVGSSIFTTSLYAGRLEIYVNGEWGTICDDFWGNNEANVACKQMGFEGAYDSDWTLRSIASSSQRIWLDDVTCTGSESQLINCNHRGLGVENCEHSENVRIRCTRSVASTVSSESVTTSITSSMIGIIFYVVISVTLVLLLSLPFGIICIYLVICDQLNVRNGIIAEFVFGGVVLFGLPCAIITFPLVLLICILLIIVGIGIAAEFMYDHAQRMLARRRWARRRTPTFARKKWARRRIPTLARLPNATAAMRMVVAITIVLLILVAVRIYIE